MSPLSNRSGLNDPGVFTRRKVSHGLAGESIVKSSNGTQVGFLLSQRDNNNSPRNSLDGLTGVDSADHSAECDQRHMSLKERLVRQK